MFNMLSDYYEKYNNPPTLEAVEVMLNGIGVNEQQYESIQSSLNVIRSTYDERPAVEWLVDETESFCKDKSLYNALAEGLQIYSGESKYDKHALPEILQNALAVSFDSNVGHDYELSAEQRYDYYTRVEERIPLDIDILNIKTRGGFPKKTLNIVMADTNVGKSLILCSWATHWLKMGKNVLYISMEMSEEMVGERIDANLLDIEIGDLAKTDKSTFMGRFKKIQETTMGKLIVKHFPTGQAHVGHFRHLLNELKLKKKFIPDVICIDYLNICSSSKYKNLSGVNSYTLVKSICEEVRGLACEFDVPIATATQANRDGHGSANLDLSNISESYGSAQTADWLVGVMALEDMPNKYLWVELKSRYNNKAADNKRFFTGVSYGKMRLFNDTSGSEGLYENKQKADTPKDSTQQATLPMGGFKKKQPSTSEWT